MDNFTSKDLLKRAETGFENNEFKPYFQPKYNITTGLLVGAEALARWIDPNMGLIPPFMFIPQFEEKGLITRLDLKMFENVCVFLKKCRDDNVHVVPISVNLSRQDIYRDGFIDTLDEMREKYDIPVELIRLEVTESIAAEGPEEAKAIIDRMHESGYIVELDDFGSGYSSLNVLKDIDYDILKMDMAFMSDDMEGKGGTIVSSVVRMAKWLEIPVIAEGVETKAQANFLRSIGCDYVQGYLFGKPQSEDDYFGLLKNTNIGLTTAAMKMKDTLNPVSFWDEKSIETLIFNNFVGGAMVFSYTEAGGIEPLRVNRKYLVELGMNMTEEDVMKSNILDMMNEEDQKTFKQMLKMAIETEEEQECETWRTICSSCCGEEKLCIRSSVIMIGKSENEYIFYSMVRNITGEKKQLAKQSAFEQKFSTVIEQANIYYWEYTIATKEMRPCFRCMRDLGLPPVVTNYPEPAIEQGIFPQDYADMYRDWHKQIEAGVPELEAIIPLTVGRVPFHVRYTTEFDELGRPVKAYGSATYLNQEEMKPIE